ncbi:MAG TPA: DUF6526 family protein [Acidobacteriaceae bacterium]|jgi:hypothetical protein|nr:DUF6526 family protein [Acidobacteriaceae bacterium]
MSQPQTYKNHHRFHGWFHFFVAPILLINFIFTVVVFFRHLHFHPILHLWLAVIAFALVVLATLTRTYALKVQDRVIRLEEQLRYQRLLTPEQLVAAQALTIRQIIGLRFASDAELPALLMRAVSEKLSQNAIKQAVTVWRPDTFRV